MRIFEVLLELIKLTSQDFTLILYFIQFPSHVNCVSKTILLYNCFSFRWIEINYQLSSIWVGNSAAWGVATSPRATSTWFLLLSRWRNLLHQVLWLGLTSSCSFSSRRSLQWSSIVCLAALIVLRLRRTTSTMIYSLLTFYLFSFVDVLF